MKIKNTFYEQTESPEGIITNGAIERIKGIKSLDIDKLRFHDAEITKLTVNYPQEGDFYIDVEMGLEWGDYSHLLWHFEGIITYNLCDDGGDRYLWDAGFYISSNDFLVADFGAFGRIVCLRAEIVNVEKFEDGVSPAQAIVDEHNESGKEGTPCVSIRRRQSY